MARLRSAGFDPGPIVDENFFGHLGGLVVATTAGGAWVFAVGQFASGLASGLLAVFGIGSARRCSPGPSRVSGSASGDVAAQWGVGGGT
jgi:hypothetical protein